MKNIFLLILLLPFYAQSQISIQAYGGNKETELLGIYNKDFSGKWNYFASGTMSYDYQSGKVTPNFIRILIMEL
ncbi:hypothetical protein [Chryseobacterium sp. Marseille-Q8038]